MTTIYLAPLHKREDLTRRERERQALLQLISGGLIAELPRGTQLGYRSDGAPLLPPDLGLGISISHSAHLIALALFPLGEGRDIGIDIEEEWAQAAKLIRRVAKPEELQLLHEANVPELLLWCAKEAAFKAHSNSLRVFSKQIELISVSPETQSLQVRIKPNEGEERIQVLSYALLQPEETGGHHALLTCTTAEMPPRRFMTLPAL